MTEEIPQEAYQAIESEIASDNSPVGIEANKTHVMIHGFVRCQGHPPRASLPKHTSDE